MEGGRPRPPLVRPGSPLAKASPFAGVATAALRSPDKSGRSYGGRVNADPYDEGGRPRAGCCTMRSAAARCFQTCHSERSAKRAAWNLARAEALEMDWCRPVRLRRITQHPPARLLALPRSSAVPQTTAAREQMFHVKHSWSTARVADSGAARQSAGSVDAMGVFAESWGARVT